MSNLAGQRILIVEDEYFLAADFVQALAALGAVVIGPASNVEAALGLLDGSAPDLAILDINLKGDISFAVADALAARGLPFVFVTGYDQGVIPPRHADRPRWQKPFDAARLLESLARSESRA